MYYLLINQDAVPIDKARAVLLGPTYYVVSCRCYSDQKLLKGRVEWCDWCRCPDCGGKQNRNQQADTFGNIFAMIPDLNAELGLALVLIGVSVWSFIYVDGFLYRVSHCIGLLSAAFCAHGVSVWFGL